MEGFSMKEIVWRSGAKVLGLAVLLAVSITAQLGMMSTASAGTKSLAGSYSFNQIAFACVGTSDGNLTAGTGSGGYGCKTSSGEVSCTKAGQCTGTCQACRQSSPPKNPILPAGGSVKATPAAPSQHLSVTPPPAGSAFAGGNKMPMRGVHR